MIWRRLRNSPLVVSVCGVLLGFGLILVLLGPRLLTPSRQPVVSSTVEPAGRLNTASAHPATTAAVATVPESTATTSALTSPKLPVSISRLRHLRMGSRGNRQGQGVLEAVRRLQAEYDLAADSAERIGVLEQLRDLHHPLILEIVRVAINDADPAVRQAAMEALEDCEYPAILPLVRTGLTDSVQDVRLAAAEALCCVEDTAVAEALIMALNDQNEEVRAAAVEAVAWHDEEVQLQVLQAGIAGQSREVKLAAIDELEDLGTHGAVDTLLLGLKDSDAAVRDAVNSSLDFLISRRFSSYAAAAAWWKANRNRYDDELFELDNGSD